MLGHNKDLSTARNEYYWAPPACVRPALLRLLLKDARDAPMLWLLLNVACFTLPGAGLVLVARSHAVGLAFWLLNAFLFQERFLLCMHFHAHRGLFRGGQWLDSAVMAALTPLFGVPCGLYHLHHVVMHHSEANRAGRDLSSTEPYQRDRLDHFALYWLRFLALIWFELPAYALRARRPALAALCAACTVAGAVLCVTLLRTEAGHHAVVWLLLVPAVFGSLPLMLGNWSQHLFIRADAPSSPYAMAYNVIDTPANQRTFNDGYHTEHHLHSRRHWSELPASFARRLDRYAREDALVFRGLDFICIGCLVFRQRYDILARHYVQLRRPHRSPAEIEALLRERLRPVVAHS
jgi:hypothetical protein